MKTLLRLIRLQKQKVDEQQQHLSGIQFRLNRMEKEISAIRNNLKNEQRSAMESVEGTLAYARYAASMKIRLDQIEKIYMETLDQYETGQQKLQDLFGEMKALEMHAGEKHKRLTRLREQKEQAFLDDLYNTKEKRL